MANHAPSGPAKAREILVVGAGIVGTTVAHRLAEQGVNVTVLDRDAGEPRGSTGFAPGLVGLYNDEPILTALARESAAFYDGAGSGFHRSGGLELATSASGAADVARRVEAARAAGLRAQFLAGDDARSALPAFVDPDTVVAAGHFPDDATANVPLLLRSLRTRALDLGARYLPGHDVVGIHADGPRTIASTSSGETFAADDVVLSCGVWGPSLAALTGLDLPLFPVAHPYVYDAPDPSWEAGPFVRWPEHHVYARIHDDRLGLGSYDHRPVPIGQDQLAGGAGLEWSTGLDPMIDSAQRLLRHEARFSPARRINGVFAMTPDNLPFLGRHPDADHVWIAQALWVTHAAGAAAALAEALLEGTELPGELAVNRFDGRNPESLRDNAMRLYRDIYANDSSA